MLIPVWLLVVETSGQETSGQETSGQEASGQENSRDKTIQPADVFVAVGLVREELELIRFVMGKPENKQSEINVSGAAPREVFFQAVTMFRKADRLCFEHTRTHRVESKLPTGEVKASDVHRVVAQTLDCIRQVKQRLGIESESKPPIRDSTKKPNDVFRSIVQANRQLNLLLEHKFAPSDVFQQITLGIGYTSRLMETFAEPASMPDEPPFEIGKRPADVYRRLSENFDRIRSIAKTSGVQMLELKVDEETVGSAEPSDVYDIASLLVSELAYLHSNFGDTKPPRDVYYVGKKFPSHVFQRAGILEKQLIELERRVTQNPKWFNK